MDHSEHQSGRKDQFILDTWESLQRASLGQFELDQIREALEHQFGKDESPSPTRIAGILAERGVRLRHPEVLRADSEWRQARIYQLFGPEELNFGSLVEAQASILKLEELRRVFEAEKDKKGLELLRALALGYKESLRLITQSEQLSGVNKLAQEVLEWLTLWLQNPEIFATWLDLRQKSPEFLATFHI